MGLLMNKIINQIVFLLNILWHTSRNLDESLSPPTVFISSLKMMSIIWKEVEFYSYTINYEEISLMFS